MRVSKRFKDPPRHVSSKSDSSAMPRQHSMFLTRVKDTRIVFKVAQTPTPARGKDVTPGLIFDPELALSKVCQRDN